MSCYHPVRGWIVFHLDGKKHITFRDPSIAACARHAKVVETTFPCGKCMGCRIKKAAEWTMRLKHEASLHDENCFVTLTYNDDHLPIINGVPSLPDYTFDFQPFMKRLRANTGRKIRFFMCSEYGSKTERPHYHVLLFGYCPHDLIPWTFEDGHWLYRSKEIEDAWSDYDPKGSGDKVPIGFVTVGRLCDETVRYVARYTLKKLDGVMSLSWFGPRQHDYLRMSLKPGIGAGWLDRYHRDVYKVDLSDGQVYKDSVSVDKGRETKPPRYYDKLMRRSDSFGPLPIDAGAAELRAALRAAEFDCVLRAREDWAILQPAADAAELQRCEAHAKYVAGQNLAQKNRSRIHAL